MLLLNTYPLIASQNLIFQAKQESLQSSTAALLNSLAGLDRLTAEGISQVFAGTKEESSGTSRTMVIDDEGRVVYDNREGGGALGHYVFYTELVQALEGYDSFYTSYNNGAFQSRAASPVVYRGKVIGAVYVYELDYQQAQMLSSLQKTLGSISVVVGVLVLGLSLLLSRVMTYRISQLLEAIRHVREGAYDHRAPVSSPDELGELAAEFNSMAQRIQTTEEVRRRFVSDASHELKTPLAAICLLSDSILQNQDMDRETVQEFVGDIGQEAERLRRITEKLLQLTRLESSKFEEDVSLIEIGPVLRRVVRTLQTLAKEKNIELKSHVSDHCYIMDNEDGLHQVIFNLTENAIKYNRPGGFVLVSAHKDRKNVILRVEDNGIGIPEEDRPQIFQRFYRVDKSRNQQSGSTGLGLAIVQESVEKRGGSIAVYPRNSGGTVFEVQWPAAEEGGRKV